MDKIYDRFVRWRRAGLFDRVLEQLHLKRASQAAASGGKRGHKTSPPTMRSAAPGAASAPSAT